MKRLLLYSFILLIPAFVWIACQRPTEPAYPNNPPDTRLSNVPKDNDTVFALATLNWTGGDNDGYVPRYQYRYITYHLQLGSNSVWEEFDSTSWKDTTGTSVTIAFNSSDNINRQQFMVRAVDNTGTVDPTPAEKIIYTTKASPPVTRIIAPVKNDTILGLNQISDWWTGITLTFTATDQTVQGQVVDYAWSVDGGAWHWGNDTNLTIAPDHFGTPMTGRHYIKVTSRNNTNLIDPVGDSASIVLQVPTFEKKVLIIDETDEFNYPFITYQIADSTTDNFYQRLFPGADSWDYKANNGMPSRTFMAHYKLVIWQADDRPQSNPHKISEPKNIAVFTDYLKVGGKFFMSGWGILKSFDYNSPFPRTFLPGSFVFDYLHIRTVDETPAFEGDCLGGDSTMTTFNSFKFDSTKLAFFPYSGKFGGVNLITSTAGFTVSLFTYINSPSSPRVTYRGRPIALRYYGTTYDAVVLGFPLYFVREEDAKVMAQQILRNLQVQ
jgi:hypothetical protein